MFLSRALGIQPLSPIFADEKECEVPTTLCPLTTELKSHDHVTLALTPAFNFQVAALDVKAISDTVMLSWIFTK